MAVVLLEVGLGFVEKQLEGPACRVDEVGRDEAIGVVEGAENPERRIREEPITLVPSVDEDGPD